jgi:hypothetical protein
MAIQVMQPGQAKTRHERRPNFGIAGVMKPYGLYPLCIHPVLPGETLKNFETKWRVISKPVKHPLAGAWLETWLCYVKMTDLDRNLGEMFISDTYSTVGHTASADQPRYFTRSGQIEWVKKCVERIHEAYFVHENETPRTIDGVPQVKLNMTGWWQNMIFKPSAESMPTDLNELQGAMSAQEMMMQSTMTELTYERYLQEYGVQSIRTGIGEPEILRYTRSWTLPTNHVEPSNGVPSSAWAWSDHIKAEKDKRFDEPGFIVQLAAIRPKLYQANVPYSMVGELWGFSDWYPVYNLPDPNAGAKDLTSDSGMFAAGAQDAGVENLMYDHKDLLSHGEQFVNEWTDPAGYTLPVSTGLEVKSTSEPEDLRGEYAKEADISGLFSSETSSDQFCYFEGISQARVAGHITDTTR